MSQALENYKIYRDSDDEFTYLLRMEYEWYQNEFDRMVSLVKQVIKDYVHKDVVPKCVVYFFVREIDYIIGTTSKDAFVVNPPEGYTKEEYTEMIELGQQVLTDMRNKFYAGDYEQI